MQQRSKDTPMNLPSLEELKQVLAPMLALQPPDADTSMGKTVGEGLTLPPAEKVLLQWPFREAVKDQLAESLAWIGSVLRHDWIAPDAAERLGPVSKGVNGEDALVGGWTSGRRAVQIVVTRERLHLLTRLPRPLAGLSEKEITNRALTLARELFQVDEELEAARWRVRPFGGVTLGNQDRRFAANWPETLLFLTDGCAFKFSILKIKGRTSPPKKGSAKRTYIPWFPYQLQD
jgi:hypothetical protein